MTFSDSRIVKFIKEEFTPVWEAAAPVKTATFHLGEGRKLKGTISGEIALYFCTPDGRVFDILPALQSPAATLIAMQEASAFYKKHKGTLTKKIVEAHHLKRLQKLAGLKYDSLTRKEIQKMIADRKLPQQFQKSEQGMEKRDNYIKQAVDQATRDMRIMVISKVRIDPTSRGDSFTVVEPGGKGYYLWEVGRRFVSPSSWISSNFLPLKNDSVFSDYNYLKNPGEWKIELFENIMKQPLIGGDVEYDSDSLEAIRIIGE